MKNPMPSVALLLALTTLAPAADPADAHCVNLISKTYDSTKLDEDADRIRQMYQRRGYFQAQGEAPVAEPRDQMVFNPFMLHAHVSKRMDILVPIHEGARYRLADAAGGAGEERRSAFDLHGGDGTG